MVVALLGILRAGAGYVPLDLGYPRERLAWMLADSGARLYQGGGVVPVHEHRDRRVGGRREGTGVGVDVDRVQPVRRRARGQRHTFGVGYSAIGVLSG